MASFIVPPRDRAQSEAYPPRKYAQRESGQAAFATDFTSYGASSASTGWINGPDQSHGYYAPQRGSTSRSSTDNDPQKYISSATTEAEFLSHYNLDTDPSTAAYVPGVSGQIGYSKKTGSKVVIKRTLVGLPSQEMLDTRREIHVLTKVSTLAIAPLIEYLDLDDSIWTTIEYRPQSTTISQIIRTTGPLSEPVIKTALNQLFAGVASLFVAGFAHLRICDATVCLDDNQTLTITDLKFACEYGRERIDDLYAPTQEKFAADIYTAPEVFAQKTYNARKAVMWSCGVLLYFMTTGQTNSLSNIDHPVFERTDQTLATISDDHVSSHEPQTIQKQQHQQQDEETQDQEGRLSSSQQRRRKFSVSKSAPARLIIYPNRFAVPSYARSIIAKMLIHNPRRRAELIEVASRVPKEYSEKHTRPLMELAWFDYKTHVGPNAGLHCPDEADEGGDGESYAASIISAASRLSNPFRSLLSGGSGAGKNDSRRKSAPATSRLGRYR